MQTLQAWLWLHGPVQFEGIQLLSSPVTCQNELVTVQQYCLASNLAGTWSKRLHFHAKGMTDRV